MRVFFKAMVCGVLLSLVFSMAGFFGACEEIRNDVFRLHVIANSDSEEDQALKLRVRDAVLEYTGELFFECRGKGESINRAESRLGEIKSLCCKTVRESGYTYPVDVYITKMYFGTRVYDSFTLPAGEYDTLRIVIGKGEGHNWWCVLFPALCLPGATGDELRTVMNDNEADIVSSGEKYEIRFKFVEWIEGLFSVFCR